MLVLLVFLAMILEIKKAYVKEEFLSQERQELLNSTQNQQKEPVVLDETSSKEVSCIESWFCTDWADCRNNVQKRACLDKNNCKTYINKPDTEQDC